MCDTATAKTSSPLLNAKETKCGGTCATCQFKRQPAQPAALPQSKISRWLIETEPHFDKVGAALMALPVNEIAKRGHEIAQNLA